MSAREGIVVSFVIDSSQAFAETVKQAEKVGEKVGERIAAGAEKGMRRKGGGKTLADSLAGSLDGIEKRFESMAIRLHRVGHAAAQKAARESQRAAERQQREAQRDIDRRYYSRTNAPTTGLTQYGPLRSAHESELRTMRTLQKAREEGAAQARAVQSRSETDLRVHGQRMTDIQRAYIRNLTSDQKRMWATMVRDQAAGTRAREAITVAGINRELAREQARRNAAGRQKAYDIYASQMNSLGKDPLSAKQFYMQSAKNSYTNPRAQSKNFAKTLNSAFQIQQAVEDFQYAGFRGISNNLAFLGSTIGGKAGLAGVLGILAYQLYDAGKALGVFGETAEQQKARVDRLAASFVNLSSARERGYSAGLASAMTPMDEIGRMREEMDVRRRLAIAERNKNSNPEVVRRRGPLAEYEEFLRLGEQDSVKGAVFGTGAPGSEGGRAAGLLASATPLGAPLAMENAARESFERKKQQRLQFFKLEKTLQDAGYDTSGMSKTRATPFGEKLVEPDYAAMDAVMEGLRKEQQQFTDGQNAEIEKAKAELDAIRQRMRGEANRFALVRQTESDADIAGRGGKRGDAERELQKLSEMRERIDREQTELRTKFLETNYDTPEEAAAAQREYLAGMRDQIALLANVADEQNRIEEVVRLRTEYQQAAVSLAREELQAVRHMVAEKERLIEHEKEHIKQIEEAKYRQRSGFEGSLFDTERSATQKFIGLREKKAQESLAKRRDHYLQRIDQMAPFIGSQRASALRDRVNDRFGAASDTVSKRFEKFAAKRDEDLVSARMKMLAGQAKAAGDPEKQRGIYEQMQQLMLSGVTATEDEGLAKKRFAEAQRLQKLIEDTYEAEKQASQGKIAAYQTEIANLQQVEQRVLALSQQAANLRIVKDADVLAAAAMNNELNAILAKLQARQQLQGVTPLSLPPLLNPDAQPPAAQAPPPAAPPPAAVPPGGIPTTGIGASQAAMLASIGLGGVAAGNGVAGIQPVIPQLAAMLALMGSKPDSPMGIGGLGANTTNIGNLIVKTNQAGVTWDYMLRAMQSQFQNAALRGGRTQPYYSGAG